jgi:hypothetical protein
MALKIGTIEYTKGDENFEYDEVKITSQKMHEEPGGYNEPNDIIETVEFEVETDDGTITGQATARRSGFDPHFEVEDVELSIDNSDDSIEISTPDCTIELDEDEY